MTTKKVKVKVKKKKIKLKKILMFFSFILAILIVFTYIINIPIKNIYILGNNILIDKEIIKISNLDDYPPLLKTYFLNIKQKLEKNDYIENVEIKRNIFGKIYIKIKEYNPVCIYNDKLILSSKKAVENDYKINYVPYVISDIESLYDKAIEKFSLIDKDILIKISHIEYVPNDVDKERFIFYMVDDNYVYITLSKIEKINKYNLIVKEHEGKKGIIYLDSGDYVEIKG